MSLPTLLEILDKSSEYFKSKGIENYRLDAQLILGHVLGLDRINLYLNFDRPLKQNEIDSCRSMVKRRGAREPLQHILGEAPFRNLMLKSDNRALVPRKETELLVDLALEFIESRPSPPSVLEIGVGTGAILLALLQESPGLNICGVDIDPDALSLARENAERLKLSQPDLFKQGDLFSPFSQQTFDLILSNPPYISRAEYLLLDPEVKNFDPEKALVGGEQGTEFLESLIAKSYENIKDKGLLITEIGHSQAQKLTEFGLKTGWNQVKSHRDYSDIPRFLAFYK